MATITAAGMAVGIAVGIELAGACSSRCWFAHGVVCECPCGGGNHGAMMPGRNKLQATRDGVELQTVMWEPDPRMGTAPEQTPAVRVRNAGPPGKRRPGKAGQDKNGLEEELTMSRQRAQQALEIHEGDNPGDVLCDFIMKHHAGSRSDWENGHHPLGDGSEVNVVQESQRIVFTWADQREARHWPGGDILPGYPVDAVPLLDWPNTASISDQVMMLAAPKALGGKDVHEENLDHQPILNDWQRHEAAPGLQEAIREFIRDRYDMPEYLLQTLDREQTECARQVLKEMPAEQLEKLYAAMRERSTDGDRAGDGAGGPE